MKLPHRYPFLFLDRVGPGAARVELAAGSFWLRSGGTLPAAFCAELVAQAAALLLAEPGGPGDTRERWLAGIDRLELARPIGAGESLEIRVRPEARFGGVVRVAGEIWCGAERIAAATLLLA